MTDTPSTEDDDLLDGGTTAPEARQHRSDRSSRRKGLKPIDIAGIVVAALVVIGVVWVIAKGHKSTSTATSTTAATPTTGTAGASTSTAAGPNATSWTYTTLDGRSVTILKGTSGSTRFALYHNNSLPLAVVGIDKSLAKNDCGAVEAVYKSDKTANPSSTANSNDRRSAARGLRAGPGHGQGLRLGQGHSLRAADHHLSPVTTGGTSRRRARPGGPTATSWAGWWW